MKKGHWAAIVGLGLLGLGFGIAYFNASDATLADEIAKSRKVGMPVLASDLALPVVADSENAEPIYRALDTQLKKIPRMLISDVQRASRSRASAKDVEAGDKALPRMEPLLPLLEQLPSRPKCLFHRDWRQGIFVLFPEYVRLRSYVHILTWKANYLGRRGDWKGALHELRLAERVSDDCGTDPVIMSLLAMDSCHLMVGRELERLADRFSRNPETLAAILGIAMGEKELPDLRYYLTGEIVMPQQFIAEFHNTLGAAIQSRGRNVDELSSPSVRNYVRERHLMAWRSAWVQLPRDSHDWLGYRRVLKQLYARVDADTSFLNSFNLLIMENYSFHMDSVATVQARNRMLTSSIALLQIRNQTGKLPSHLPASLGQDAIDPFDGKGLHYRPTDHGFKIYSIGRDRKDNHGRVKTRLDHDSDGTDEIMEFH